MIFPSLNYRGDQVCIYQTGSPIPSNECYTTSYPQANLFPRNVPMPSWRTWQNPLPCLGFMPLCCYKKTSGCSEQFIKTVCVLQTRYTGPWSNIKMPSYQYRKITKWRKRRSYDRLISTTGFLLLVRCRLYIESGHRFSPYMFVFGYPKPSNWHMRWL